jgi:uncharacterized low-complexity protein
MAYGYYSDPGNTFGNTGQNNTQETFIQRQKRLQQQSQPKAAPQPTATPANGGITSPTSGTPSTPVSGSGKIPEPAPAPAPPPPPPPPAPMTTEQLEAAAGMKAGPGNNLVVLANGQMVDRNHPIYIEALNAQKTKTPTAAPAGPAGPTAGTAQGGPAEAAKSGMFTQYAAPEHDFQNFQQLEMISNLLANPHTLGATTVEQMKQKSMEEALLMQQQALQQAAEERAALGRSDGGGLAEAQKRKLQENLMTSILGSNRDIDIMSTQQNRADELQALQAAEAILGGQVGRSGDVFGNILAGQGANRDDYFRGRSLDLQEKLGIGGLDLDAARVGNQASQFNAAHALDRDRFTEDIRQFNNQLGLQYNQLGLSGQNATIDQILQMIGR